MFLKCASASNENGWILFDFHVNRKRLLPKMQLAAQLPCIHHGGLGNREHPFLSGKGVSTEVYILKAFLRSTRTTGSEKRYNTNVVSRESSRMHLRMLVFEVSRTSVFRLEHFTAAINRAFEHFRADGMCRGDVCS